MGRRLSTATIVLALLFANAFYAPPVEAANFSSVPATINGYINDIINFFGDLFSAPAPPPPAVPVPVPTPVPASPSTPTTTIINRTVYLPASSSPSVTISGVTQAQLTGQLAALETAIEAKIPTPTQAIVYDTATRSDSGQTLTNLTVSGVTGLTASDIPNLSGSYLSTAGGTVAGNLTVTGNVGIGPTINYLNSNTASLYQGKFLDWDNAWNPTSDQQFHQYYSYTFPSVGLSSIGGQTASELWASSQNLFSIQATSNANNANSYQVPLIRTDVPNHEVRST